ncbi:SMI1/KNR4 family protein [Kitasatospora cathayae]|uniref:hypothetical protein n=1 Tax=Kitasatospora cathayae TaxID=3004092 RepID=UPI002FD82E13
MINIDGARLGADAARRLRQADCCTIEPGLSDDEFERIEEEYGIRFSDDHRAFLAAGLPVCSPPEEGVPLTIVSAPNAPTATRQP